MINPDLKEINERIDETKSKLNLLEGDEKAYYENAIATVSDAKRKILTLRRKNYNLRKELASCKQDEKLRYYDQEFENVLVSMDNKTCDAMRKLNLLRFETASKEKKLNELIEIYEEKMKEFEEANLTFRGISDDGKRLRDLENQLEKTKIKCQESEHVKKTYQKIKDKLIAENLVYSKNLDNLEQEMVKLKKLLEEIRSVYQDARTARDNSIDELKKTELMIMQQRKKREYELSTLKRMAENNVANHARHERNFEDTTDTKDQELALSEENLQQLKSYEDNFMKIKEVLGVISLEDSIEKFTSQIEKINRLKDSNAQLEEKIEEMKKLKQDLEEELKQTTFDGNQEINELGVRIDESSKNLTDLEMAHMEVLTDYSTEKTIYIQAKAGIERLFKVLASVRIPEVNESIINEQKWYEDSPETILEVLGIIEKKLRELEGHLSREDLNQRLEELSRAEYRELLHSKEFYRQIGLKQGNEKKKVPILDYSYNEDGVFEEPDVLSRVVLKKLSQALIDQKTRKKNINNTKQIRKKT